MIYLIFTMPTTYVSTDIGISHATLAALCQQNNETGAIRNYIVGYDLLMTDHIPGRPGSRARY